MFNLFKAFKKKDKSERTDLLPVGFHGDLHLIAVVDFLIRENNIKYFIETGTNVGSTLKYTSNKYPNILCLSCEPDYEAFKLAVKNVTNPNVKIFNMLSQNFLHEVEMLFKDKFDQKVLFWLDAHGYGFEWPIRMEIDFITTNFTNAFILIDDFKVPDKEMFGYDIYKEQECRFEYIEDFIKVDKYDLYYPNYSEKTSNTHPLRGWGLITTGDKLEIPKALRSSIRKWA